MSVLIIGLYIVLPALVLYVQDRVPLVSKLGAVTVCYLLGIIMGNMPFVRIPGMAGDFSGLIVAIAIPVLMFNSDIRAWRSMGGPMVKSFACCIVAVIIAAIVGTIVFEAFLKDSWKSGSMMVGVYTGGTPNLAAIGKALHVDDDLIVLIQGGDLVIGGAWLIFLLMAAKYVYGLILPIRQSGSNDMEFSLDERLYWKGSSTALLLGIVVTAASVGISQLLHGQVEYIPLFLTVTTAGIALSFVQRIRTIKGSFGMGNYLLLVFCIAVGSLANVHRLADAGLTLVLFVGLIMLISIAIHLMLSRLLRIDRDTTIIASTAALYGPPFVPPVAEAIGNPRIISIGLALSLLGLAIGTYCGIGISYLLRLL